MARNPVLGGVSRGSNATVSSIACLVFVFLMAVAFWAGAVWIGRTLLTLSAQGV
jgi:hypothetical protein